MDSSSADFWLKPLDLRSLSDEAFTAASAEMAKEARTTEDEDVKVWAAAYKRERLRRGIITSSKAVAQDEQMLRTAYLSWTDMALIEERLASEIRYLNMMWGDMMDLGPETAEGAECPELQAKRIALVKTEKEYVNTKAQLKWPHLCEAEENHLVQTLNRLETARKTLVAEIKALMV
jgi:hypothetical protein